jgi:hypothetical protein
MQIHAYLREREYGRFETISFLQTCDMVSPLSNAM